jgi:hypothetical protein
MTHTISMSRVIALGSKDVQEDLNYYVEALQTWAEHHKRVREDAQKPLPREPKPEDFGNGDNEGFEKAYQAWSEQMENIHQPYPMDTHCEDFMKAVSIDDQLNVTTDYQLVDDRPTPGDLLRQKKDVLINQIAGEENRRQSAILPPPGRVRHQLQQVLRVQSDDQRRRETFIKSLGDISAMPEEAQEEAQKKIASRALEEGRPDEDNKLYQAHHQQQAECTAIREEASSLMNEVEDLTEENIDAWKPVWKE